MQGIKSDKFLTLISKSTILFHLSLASTILISAVSNLD